MKKSECEKPIRSAVTKWAAIHDIQVGQSDIPDYDAFRKWMKAQGLGHYLEFRSVMGAYEDAERWFNEELRQTWRD